MTIITDSLIGALIFIVPLWNIFTKAGKNPAISLVIFIPLLGFFIAVLVLAFSNWPNTESNHEGVN